MTAKWFPRWKSGSNIPPTLTEKIKAFALEEAGFDLVGISGASLPEFHEKSLLNWVENGYAGSMEYMTRDAGRRAHPKKILPSVRSVISLAVNYFHPEDAKPAKGAHGKVAKYAYGRDYHQVIEKKLKKLSRFTKESGGAGTEVKHYVDTGPVLEKAFASQAGLGFFGKNTNIITRGYGSWVFLASLITNLELEIDAPHLGSCGSCRICIDACPTEALLGDYTLDARRCISYLTIEAKEAVPSEMKQPMGEWIFGCDICQDVCPYNHWSKNTKHPEFYTEKKAGTWINLENIEIMPGSPLKRGKMFKIPQ